MTWTIPAPVYPQPGQVQLVVRGNHGRIADAQVDAIAGAGNAYRFTTHYDIVLPHVGHLHYTVGEVAVLPAEVKAALVAAGAPMTAV